MTTPTLPPEIEAALVNAAESACAVTDAELASYVNLSADAVRASKAAYEAADKTLRTAITSALAAAREAGRREVLEGAAGVESSMLKLAAVAYSQGTHAVRARIGEHGADLDHLRASGDLIVAEQSHRAAIVADKARAVEAASAGRHLCDLAGCDAPVTHIEKAAVVVNRDGATGRQDIWTCEEHADVGAVLLHPVLSAEDMPS